MPLIPIPYGTKYSVTTKSSVWVPRKCDWCKSEYAYLAKFEATGASTDVLWMDKQSAKNNAAYSAINSLERQKKDAIKNPNDNYSCPNCGKYSFAATKSKMNDTKFLKYGSSISVGFIVILLVPFGEAIIHIIIGLITMAAILFFWKANGDPNIDADKRINQSFSENYPVLSRKALEEFAYKSKISKNQPIELPEWSQK